MFAQHAKSIIKGTVRTGFRRVGFDLRRARPTTADFPRLAHFLRQKRVATVLDVGANRGQFAKALLAEGFVGEVISFEPLPQLRAQLLQDAEACSGRWRIGPEIALSDRRGEQSFNVSENLASSSLLTVLASSVAAAPESATSNVISVQTDTLDAVLPSLHASEPVFLKIDTQGAESAVLQGGRESLKSFVGVKLELSLSRLYAGQELAHTLDQQLIGAGFNCWDIVPGFRNRETGRLLQYDGVYFRDG